MEPQAQRKRVWGIGVLLRKLTGLSTYGEESNLSTSVVRNWLTMAALIIVLQWVLDTVIWTAAAMYATHSIMLAIPAGMIVATFLAIYDLSAHKADTSQSKRPLFAIGGRIIISLVLCFLTAVPLEIMLYSSEINHRIERKEQLNGDTLLDNAIATENKYFDDRIAEEKKAFQENTEKASGTGQQDVNALAQSRKEKRDQIESRYNGDKQALYARMMEADQLISAEASGKVSPQAGIGPLVLSMQDSKSKATAELEAVRVAQQSALEKFDAETETLVKQAKEGRDEKTKIEKTTAQGRIDKLIAQKKTKMEELRAMTTPAKLDELARAYKGTWREPRGFLAMMQELDKMRLEDETVEYSVWGARLLLAILSIMAIGLKLMYPLEVIRFFSMGAQAAAGDKMSQTIVTQMGYGLHDQYAHSRQARELLSKIDSAYRELTTKLRAFQIEAGDICQPNEQGLCPQMEAIRLKLRSAWAKNVDPAYQGWITARMEAMRCGVESPKWEAKDVANPLEGVRPWSMTESELKELGWSDPAEDVANAREAQDNLASMWREYYRKLYVFRAQMLGWIRSNPNIPREDLDSKAFTHFANHILPMLEKIDQLESLVIKGGLPLCNCPTYIQDPRADLDSVWRFEESNLRRMGWLNEHKPKTRPAILDDVADDQHQPDADVHSQSTAPPAEPREEVRTATPVLPDTRRLTTPPPPGQPDTERWFGETPTDDREGPPDNTPTA